MIKISPSVLAADLSRLADEVAEIEAAGADMVHLDVMDGVFVTNITFGLPVIESLRKKTGITFDVHLMIDKPERYVERFIDAGADILTFHVEACEDTAKTLKAIKARGCLAAVSVKPNTPVEDIYEYLDLCDMVLVMTVEPGYGGQALIPECLEKVKSLRREITARGLDIMIQVDGGINTKNAPDAIAAGADVLVAGSAVFSASNKAEAIRALRG
ncbi:MAG: ribulose-phosphate 3-epimerase [Clostridia bacterium]|nr:ribulose-phosphate 3-epimerase [Clostridia bacterium]